MNRTLFDGKTVLIILFLAVIFIQEYWHIVLPIVCIGLFIFLYPKWTHMEHQKKLLDLEILKKKAEIEWGYKDMNLKEAEFKMKLIELQSKVEKRQAKKEELMLMNEILRAKVGSMSSKLSDNQMDDFINQINNLQ